MIYLDNAATTLKKPDKVKTAMLDAMENCTNAGRGGYKTSVKAADLVFTARERIGELFGVDDISQIAFTHNATHSLNFAIKGLAKKGDCIISGYEHNSVLRPLNAMKKNGVNIKTAKARLFDAEGIIKAFKERMSAQTTLAVCTHMSNVFGFILPIKEIDNICYSKGIPLVIDASQSAGSVDVKLSDLRATKAICMPGHKGLYGPQGTGILICRDGSELSTIIEGGTGSLSAEAEQPDFMPDKFESGTLNIPGIAGLSEGVGYILQKGIDDIFEYTSSLIEHLAYNLFKIPGITIYAARERKMQGGVLSFTAQNFSAGEIAERLGEKDISVRSGMHCAPLAHETVGTAKGTTRVSVSSFTTEEEISKFVRELRKIVKIKN